MKYYLRQLHEMNGTLHTYSGEPGSVTGDPHDLFPKQVRKMWRKWDARDVELGFKPTPHTKTGLAYGIWALPDSTWSVAEAAAWAEKNPGLMELYVILYSSWKPTRLAVHPDNPVVFDKPLIPFEE